MNSPQILVIQLVRKQLGGSLALVVVCLAQFANAQVAQPSSISAPSELVNRTEWVLNVEKLPAPINTEEYDEISPVVSRDGSNLYFTRAGSPDFNRNLMIDGTDAQDSLNQADYENLLRKVYQILGSDPGKHVWKSRFNQDIWMAELGKTGSLLELHHPETPLNNALPNALASSLPEQGHYLVINQFPRKGGLEKGFSHTYRRGDDTWSYPEPIEIDNYYTSGEGIGGTVSEDGEVLILSLQRAGGFGETDLYISYRIDSTHWSEPKNLGDGVNTAFRESTPSLSEDKQTLYFSSNRWGRGGNDIYFCRRLDNSWSNWSLARRFKPPISSDKDDSQPYFNEATGYLYFASNRDGSSDIYRVLVQEPKPVDVLVIGHVIHARTGEPLDAIVNISQRSSSESDTTLATVNGRFDYRMNAFRDLIISADKEGYIGHVTRLNMRKANEANTYEVDLLLDPEEKGGTITLDPIFFEQSLAEIKKQSEPQLERLRDVLLKYPNIYVRIEGHTDNQGLEAANDKLSRERATTIKNYLTKNGIPTYRVQAAGFGGRRPVADNSTQEGRETNRRVEVVITRILTSSSKS